jgi:hypothetical protein
VEMNGIIPFLPQKINCFGRDPHISQKLHAAISKG